MDGDGGRPSARDRERAADVLRERMASGRLSLGEYQGRLRRVKAAATMAELDAVVHDLRDRAAERDDAEPAGRPVPTSEPGKPGAGQSSGPGERGRARGGCAGVLALAVIGAVYAVRGVRAG